MHGRALGRGCYQNSALPLASSRCLILVRPPDYLLRNDLSEISRCIRGRLKSLRDSLQTRKIISSTFPKGPQFLPVQCRSLRMLRPLDEGLTRIWCRPRVGAWPEFSAALGCRLKQAPDFGPWPLLTTFKPWLNLVPRNFLFLNIFKMWRADQTGLEVNRMRLGERNWQSGNLHNYQRLATEVQWHWDGHNEGEFCMGDDRRESMAQLERWKMNFVHSKKEGVLVMANLRSMVSLYSPIILSRSAWNSPIRSFSFFRWLFVIVVRVRSVGVPSSHPFTRRLAMLPLSSCSSSPLIARAIFVTCAISASMRSRRAFIACARCTPLLSSFASWSFASNSLMLSICVLIFSISAKNRVKSLSPPMLVICTLGPVSKSSS